MQITINKRYYDRFLKIVCCFLLFFTFSQSNAESDPVKFGKIDISLLEMKVYDKDTSADAVVICDYGFFNPYDFTFTRIYRLKILKKSGCDRANFNFNARNKSNIKGITYNLVNGKIVKTKLSNESIFVEDIDNRYFRYKIAMPDIQVGSVIDIQTTFSGIPATWYFQSDIPVLWSELRLYPRFEIGIQKIFYGFESFTINENDRWVCKDIPALKKEPYMNNLDNYLTKFELEFSSITIPEYLYFADFTSSWEAVTDWLLQKSTISRELETIFFMGDEVQAINDSCKTEKEKLSAAYEIIKKKIKWNDEEYLYPTFSSSIKQTLKKGTGNAGEINLALILLLRKLNIEAYPVALSTRNNGILSFLAPSIDKLNYLIVLAKIDDKDYLLDATDPFLPLNYLPERCINGSGRLLKDKTSDWIELKPGGKNKISQFVDLTITNEGDISGNSQCIHSQYAAFLFRKKYAIYNDKTEFTKEIEKNNPGILIKTSNIEDLDAINKPIIVKQTFDYSANTDGYGNTLTFVPAIFDRLTSNPFNLEERKFPIDFITPFEFDYHYNYIIPDGYKVQKIPGSISIALPEKKGKFVYESNINEKSVQISFIFSITNAIFIQDEYQYIKQLYSEVVKKEAEPIVLIKE